MKAPIRGLVAVALAAGMVACSSNNNDVNAGNRDTSPTPTPSATPTATPTPTVTPTPTPPPAARTFLIEPGEDATSQMLTAIVQARSGDTIEFGCGFFDLTSGIQLIGTENITIKGCGKDATVLSFRNSLVTLEGILATNVRGLFVSDLTIVDTQANGIELRGVRFATLRNVRTMWSSGRNSSEEDTITADNYAEKVNVPCTQPTRLDPRRDAQPGESGQASGADFSDSPDYTVSTASGRYGIYPVNSANVLIENSESIGASDAGIYVGQTKKAIIRNSRTAFNVFGFEIENVQGGMYEDNLAECNTGGFLIYDLDNLAFHGKRTVMRRNVSQNNNTYNFAEPGSIVSQIPRGSGMITLAYDKIDIYDNEFVDNDTGGIIFASYELLGGSGDLRQDGYSEALNIHNNVFRNNGNVLQDPDLALVLSSGGEEVASVLPMLVGLKSQAGGREYRGAHIVWDGLIDSLADCPYPTDENGEPIPADEDGKPESGFRYPEPDCTYNAYKFDEETGIAELDNRIAPLWWFMCIDPDTNEFADDSETYINFHGTKGVDDGDFANFPATFDVTEHYCQDRFGSTLDPLDPVVLDEYVPSASAGSQFSAAEIAELCDASDAGSAVNFDAAVVNCPTMDGYNLFADASDPRSEPNGGGVPFVLNTKLFSDYAVKYRVAFLPPGESALYKDRMTDSIDATMLFPVGTILAKTFAFADETAGTERLIETRLLIKRANDDGTVYWSGIPYIWGDDGVARLALEGGMAEVSWDFTDADSGAQYQGSTTNYVIPHQNQCSSCHFNLNVETGAAPIGPKARHLNRPYAPESGWNSAQAEHPVLGVNQLQYWCESGLLSGCPDDLGVDPDTQIAANAPRNPKYNVPGDSGFEPDSAEDIEARVKAYLEINCQHCHNANGFAQNTGVFFDVENEVGSSYGVCKRPTAAGSEGRGGHTYDIVPGAGGESILPYRIGPDAVVPAAKMPPLARSVVHEDAHQLIVDWITNVVVPDEAKYPNSTECAGDGGGGGGDGGFPPLPIR